MNCIAPCLAAKRVAFDLHPTMRLCNKINFYLYASLSVFLQICLAGFFKKLRLIAWEILLKNEELSKQESFLAD